MLHVTEPPLNVNVAIAPVKTVLTLIVKSLAGVIPPKLLPNIFNLSPAT